MINFIQIGANVGFDNSVSDIIYFLIKQNQWSGILIEPMPSSFERLKQNYKDTPNLFFEQVAISNYEGDAKLFYYSDSPDDLYQQASIVKGHWRNDISIDIKCTTLETIIEKYNLLDVDFDLLQIDAEKHDSAILLATDFTRIKPNIIRYEIVHEPQNKELVANHLKAFGYEQIEDPYKDLCQDKGQYDIVYKRREG